MSKFQRQCRFHYKEFIVSHNYLRSLTAIVKKWNVKIWQENNFKKKFINQEIQGEYIFFIKRF